MSRLPVTVLVPVKNEAANLARSLAALGRFERVIVIDSHSVDLTASIAQRFGAEVVQFDYAGGYPKKRQWALDALAIETPWALLLDADEVVPPALIEEIAGVVARTDARNGYLVTKGFHFLGRRFRFGGFSHAAVAFIRPGRARFERLIDDAPDGLDMEVHERLIVDGPVGRFRTPLIHDDGKGLDAYLAKHRKYATWEARVRSQFLATGRWGNNVLAPRLFGDTQQRRRFLKQVAMRLPAEPWLWWIYHFVLRCGFLEGRRGWMASRIRARYIADVRAKMRSLDQRAASLPTGSLAKPLATPISASEPQFSLENR